MSAGQQVRHRIEQAFDRLEATGCQANIEHADKFKISFVCHAKQCGSRLVCSMCMAADEDHKRRHRGMIKRLAVAKADAVDGLIDTFACDIELITKDAEQKYTSKLKNCSQLVHSVCEASLAERMAVGASEIEDHFKAAIADPVISLAEESKTRLNQYLESIVSDTECSPAKQIENFFDFLEHKSNEEKHIWDTSGKIIQRLKHNILYNKEIETNLTSDVQELTEKFIADLVKTYQSYFFIDKQVNADIMQPSKLSPVKKTRQSHQKNKSDYKLLLSSSKPQNSSNHKASIHASSTSTRQAAVFLNTSNKPQSHGSRLTAGKRQSHTPPSCHEILDVAVVHDDVKAYRCDDMRAYRCDDVLVDVCESVKRVSDHRLVSQFDAVDDDNKENDDVNSLHHVNDTLKMSQFTEIADISPKKQLNDMKKMSEMHMNGAQALKIIDIRPHGLNLLNGINYGDLSAKSQCTKRLNFTESTAQPKSLMGRTAKSLLLKYFRDSHFLKDGHDDNNSILYEVVGSTVERTTVDQAVVFMADQYLAAMGSCYAYLQATSLAYPYVSWLQMTTTLNKIEIVRSVFDEDRLEEVIYEIMAMHGCVGLTTWLSTEDYLNSQYAALTPSAYKDCLVTVAILCSESSQNHTSSYREGELTQELDSFMIEYLRNIELLIDTGRGPILETLSKIEISSELPELITQLYELLLTTGDDITLERLCSILKDTSLLVDDFEAQFCFSLSAGDSNPQSQKRSGVGI